MAAPLAPLRARPSAAQRHPSSSVTSPSLFPSFSSFSRARANARPPPPPLPRRRDEPDLDAAARAESLRSLIGGDLSDNPRWRWPQVPSGSGARGANKPGAAPPPPPSSDYASGLRWPFVGSGFRRSSTGELAERLRQQGVDVDAVMEGREPGGGGGGGGGEGEGAPPSPRQQQQQQQQQRARAAYGQAPAPPPPQQQQPQQGGWWQRQPPPQQPPQQQQWPQPGAPPPPPPPPPPFGFPPAPPGFSASRFGARAPQARGLPTSDAEARGMSPEDVLGAMRSVQREREGRRQRAQDGEVAAIARAFLAATAGIVALSAVVGGAGL